MEIDFGTPDSDEGVELSPTANVSSIDLLGYALEEEKSIPLFSEAETVYILLPKDVAVSRASRFQWLLDHLNTVVSVPSRLKLDVASPNLEVISVVPKKGEAACTNKYLITTKTSVKFLAYSYCFVYCVDMSPSQSAVDIQKGEILFDEIVQCIKAMVEGLCRQFTIPGNSLVFQPSVYLTVIVNTPFFMSPAQQVLVEGVQITAKNVHEIINLIEGQFHFLEERIAQVSAIAHDEIELQQSEREHISSSVFYINECGENVSNIPIVLPDVNFVNMLRYSMLAISLLPENSLSNILVVTDGVVAMPDSNIMESLLMQLHYDSISVSFLKVGSSFHPQTSAGYISYTDLLHFISQATLGSCLEDFPFVKLEPSLLMNKYQESFLLWSFQNKINYDNILATQSRPIHSNDIFDKRFPILLCKRQTEENINASTDLLVSRRMREGYNVDSVNYNDNFLHISLSLHWKALIYIQYHMYYQWPLIKNIVRVEIHILAPYEFLHDITCVMRKELKSSYRQAVIERFWLRISQLSKGDSFLAQQLSFMPNSSVWYMLPESVKSGIPVFILQGSDPTKLILTPSDVSSTKFVSLWQSICQIETSNWRKWFHTYKLSVALKYDHPLPKHLHLANSSGRYQVIQCRQAASSLYSLLSEWASFVLIDNHTYLKLLFEEPDKPPAWFCLVRITSKFPCAIVNLAFLTSTPGATRRKICEELQYDLSLLSYSSSPVKSKENLCCTLLKKPLERVLIRYERIPTDFTTVVFPDGTQPSYTMRSFPPSPLASTLFTTLSRYLYHKRWIWSTSHVINPKLELPTVSRILSILTRMRIKEGFSFAHSSSGIITMVLELSMEPDSTCMVQYVLFPPHRAWREGECVSGSEEDGDVDMELESELQMVTEVWVEPQYGTVSLSDSQTNNHFNHKCYYELADVIYRLDSECISSLLTLEHLSLICQNKTAQPMYEIGKHKHRSSVAGRYKRSPNQNSLRNSFIERICDVKERIQHVPFNFDPISILSLCQQTELLFSMFIESSDRVVALNQYDHEKSNRLLLDTIHEHLQYLHDYEFDVTTEESERLMEQIMSRHRNKFSHVCPITNKAFNTSDLMLQWKCYIKGISKMHVILTFVPATLCSLKKLVSIEGTYTPSLNDSSESTECASSRGSNVSDVPINASSTLVLPVYVFDCPLALLVESYINDVTNTVMVDRDVYEDHRFKFGFHVHEDSVRLKGDESMETRHYEMESNESKNSIKSHCKALVLTHSKCFVLSLFATLQHGFYVHTSDVHFAMDQCDETVHDIDITYYLQTICGHMKSNEVGQISVESLHQPLLCNELKPLHHLIKDRFSDIMNAAFSPIPSNREFYYCRNLVVDKQVAKVDSDDEISIPPSDGVEFKSDKEASSSSEVTSNFMRLDSTNSILINSLITPLFIHLICTVRYGSNVANSSVKVLPTCLGELIENIHSDVTFLEKSSLQITLDILCLTLPLDVQNVINDYSTRGMRTTSFCSDGFPPSVASTTSEASFPAEFSDPLGHLPDLQKRAISNLKDKIKWLLKDEIATALLDVDEVSSETLNFVMNHVTDNIGCSSCILDCIDLNFVYGPLHSYDKFVQEFSKIKIPFYKLCKERDIYYLTKSVPHGISQVDKYAVTEFISENFLIDLCIGSAEKLHAAGSLSVKSEPFGIAEVSEDNSIRNEVFSQQSDTSSVNESYYGTDGGYDEDISEDEEDYSWLMRMDKKRKDLPNFWLIMCVDREMVKIYFHCRFLELPTTHVGVYLQVQRSVCDAIRDLCKRVNQCLLLQALNDTRNCHLLLEPDDDFKEWHNNASTPILTGNSSFSRLKSMDEASEESDPYPVPLIDASFKFSVGYFSCPVVWETQFILHPRLKAGYGKSGSSRGVPALKTVLDKLSVVNRSNMFVYQDVKSNVFYLRLHENVQNFCNKSVTRSNEFENAIVSRSPSIASLPLGPQKNTLTQSQHSIASSNSRESDIRPRVRSFGEKETKDNLIEDTLILRVHGITEAGEDIRCDLVQVLQNRLDDAILECLSIMLARNAMCPLTPEDVHFLQKPFRPPENIIKLSIQSYAIKYLNSFIHYLRQNLLQFLNIPKYSDNRSHYHFKDYSENDSSIKLSDNIFIYNQSQNPASGSRGIVCIALAIIPRSENTQNDVVDFAELFNTMTFEELVHTNQYADHDKPSSTYIEFRLWKQGRVNTDNLTYKLCEATRQSMWDILTEYHLLHSPLCEKDLDDVINMSKTLHKTDATPLTFSEKEVGCSVVINTNLLSNFKKKAQHSAEPTVNVNETPKVLISQKHKNYIPLNSTARRSILFNDYIENAEHKDERKKALVKFNNYELGNEGVMTKICSTTLHMWLNFGVDLAVPAVRKNVITLSNPHMMSTIVQEIRSIIGQLSQETAKAFTPVNGLNNEVYIRYNGSQLPAKVIIVSRNFEQWRACTSAETVEEYYEMANVQKQKHVQKFSPAVAEDASFVPRQKFLWAIIQSNKISFYTYNWSKDSINKLVDLGRNVGLWLSTRAAVLSSITAQKLGIFYNQTLTRNYLLDTNNPYLNFIGDVEFMMKFSRDYGRRLPSSGIMQPMVTLEAFRDIYPHVQWCHSDPVVLFTTEVQEMKRSDKKHKDELKKLHSMWQSRTSTCTSTQIQILKQNSRVTHFCHTPLLFLKKWRVQSASTRDHALHSSTLNGSFGSEDSKSSQEHQHVWHDNLCQLFIMEYKRYLQTFGFIPLQIENTYKKRGFFKIEHTEPIFYVQKAMLGGILIFSIHLKEPFLITKLHAIECSRLQSSISRTSINQLLSFLDESDRIKIVMHLHSFTYDFHLRCIRNYISNSSTEDKVCEGYHLTHFLEDFMKYYNKAPNFARNLVHEETISIHDLSTESKQLYDYLLSNVNQYGMEAVSMQGNNCASIEYVLVQMGNIPQTSYKDSQDYQHTDEFDVTLIITRAHSESDMSDRTLHLKYYLILTSHREVFPKLESDRSLGKFRAVSSMLHQPSISGRESQVEDDSVSSVGSHSSVVDSDVDNSESHSQSLQEEAITKTISQHTTFSHATIKQESVNYLGYYSSHERMMQELILEQSCIGQKKIREIVSQGMVDCRTHLLWNKLVSPPESTHLTYNEFIELKNLATLTNLSDIHSNLSSLLHQPLSWYQGLSKLLLTKYTDQHRMFISPDGNIQHYVILHHRYDGAFMLLSMDLHTSRGDLYAVYRTSSKHDVSDICLNDRKALLDGFINCVCFYIWTSLL